MTEKTATKKASATPAKKQRQTKGSNAGVSFAHLKSIFPEGCSTIQGWCDLCRAEALNGRGGFSPSNAAHHKQCQTAGCEHPSIYFVTDRRGPAFAVPEAPAAKAKAPAKAAAAKKARAKKAKKAAPAKAK